MIQKRITFSARAQGDGFRWRAEKAADMLTQGDCDVSDVCDDGIRAGLLSGFSLYRGSMQAFLLRGLGD